MPIVTRKCERCGERYDVLIVGGRVIGNLSRSDGDEDNLRCVVCNGDEFSNIVSGATGVVSDRYPRFDRGLKMWLTSERHRLQVCKERGLVPVDGEVDLGPSIAEQAEHNARMARYNAYQDKLKHSSEFAGYRRYCDTQLKDLQAARQQDAKNGLIPRERL